MAGGHAIVTGGSSGIGLAIALRLARRGDRLSLLARTAGPLQAACAACAAAGAPSAHAYPVDVADAVAVTQAIENATADHGAPDLLVASAGIALPHYFEQLEAADFTRLMAVNYFGTLHAIRAVLPAMRTRGAGHLVLISSGAGLVGVFGYAAYAPTKFAVRGLAEVLRAELRGAGIGVSVVFPPDTDTPQLAAEAHTKPAETAAVAGAARVWTADAVARVTLRGVAHNRFYITPGWEMSVLGWGHSLLRYPLQRYFDWVAARAARA